LVSWQQVINHVGYASEIAYTERSIKISIHLYKILLATTDTKITGNFEVISHKFNAHRFCRQVFHKKYKNSIKTYMNDNIASVYNLICNTTCNKNNYRCQPKNKLINTSCSAKKYQTDWYFTKYQVFN
jgi:hypothetical protein